MYEDTRNFFFDNLQTRATTDLGHLHCCTTTHTTLPPKKMTLSFKPPSPDAICTRSFSSIFDNMSPTPPSIQMQVMEVDDGIMALAELEDEQEAKREEKKTAKKEEETGVRTQTAVESTNIRRAPVATSFPPYSEPPTPGYFSYNLDNLPDAFTAPHTTRQTNFIEDYNKNVRKYYARIRAHPDISASAPFATTPTTCGEMAIICVRKQYRQR